MDNWKYYHPAAGYWFFSDYNRIISILESLPIKSDSIHSMYRHLEYSIDQDNNKNGINSELIVVDIAKSIQWLSQKIVAYIDILKYLENYKEYDAIFRLSDYSRNFILDTVVRIEKIDLSNLITHLTGLIQKWIQIHQKELLEVEEELEKQVATTESLSGQWALDLQRVRLHEHIENLNAITNTL